MQPCFNPDCDNEISTVGVCVKCAGSDYKPEVDGIQISPDTVLKGSQSDQPFEVMSLD